MSEYGQKMASYQLKWMRLCSDAVAPKRASRGAAGFDLVAVSEQYLPEQGVVIYGTGLAVEIPLGFVGLLFPRSSVYKTCLQLANSVGVIDSDYRGEIKVIYRAGPGPRYRVGERVCQLVLLPVPRFELTLCEALSVTERGAGGFGSTGQ